MALRPPAKRASEPLRVGERRIALRAKAECILHDMEDYVSQCVQLRVQNQPKEGVSYGHERRARLPHVDSELHVVNQAQACRAQ